MLYRVLYHMLYRSACQKQARRLCLMPMGLLTVISMLVCRTSVASIVLDGKLTESAWDSAYSTDGFLQTEPLTGEPAPDELSTQSRVFSTRDGLYVGFINRQPVQSLTRVKSGRDQSMQSDYNEVIIDASGKGNRVYGFTVSASESVRDSIWANRKENVDWNGLWYSAVNVEDSTWSSEIYIPWSTIAAWQAEGDDQQSLRFYFRRNHQRTGVQYAYPETSEQRQQFLQHFVQVPLQTYGVSNISLAPYVSSASDDGETVLNTGLDLSAQYDSHRINLGINPDFAQVEADELVVNFTSQEIVLPEKRAFFLENQSLFDVGNDFEDFKLIETRRMGVDPDSGALLDINLALKYMANIHSVDVGIFTVTEDDLSDVGGKDFYVLRVRQGGDGDAIGLTSTLTRNDSQGREARVNALDLAWQSDSHWNLASVVALSSVSQEGVDEARGMGLTADFNYRPNDSLSTTINSIYIEEDFELNDAGYTDRSNVQSILLTQDFFFNRLPQDAWFRQAEFGIWVDSYQNLSGERLSLGYYAAQWSAYFYGQFDDTAYIELDVSRFFPGIDDQLLADATFKRPGGLAFELAYGSPESDDFRVNYELAATQLATYTASTFAIEAEAGFTVQLNSHHQVSTTLSLEKNNDWLIEDNDTALPATFWLKQTGLSLQYDFIADEQQEFNLKFQWLYINARGKSLLAPGDDRGYLQVRPDRPADFQSATSALQLRYRYEFLPLSNIYWVYSRSGMVDELLPDASYGRWLRESLDTDSKDNVLLKVRYQF